jgi:hypothetical protein
MASLLVLKSPQQPLDEALIDEYGELARQMAASAPAAKRYKELTRIINLHYVNHPAGETATAEGSIYRILISEKCEERKLNLAARISLFALLGKERAMELFTVTLKAAEEAPEVGKALVATMVTTEPTGYRTLRAVTIAPVEQQRAA